MTSRALLLALLALAAPASSAEPMPPLICGGVEPFWDLRIAGDRATYATPELQTALSFDIPHRSIAEGRVWPRALSLIGPRDSAVAVIDRRSCSDTASDRTHPYAAHLLTQRRGEAILLTGCCRLAPTD
ncbi:MAG: hypothetical protein AAFR17_08145 [Pseudomonadota bacterium]